LQVNAAQPRHLHIGDKARCVVNPLGFKKIIVVYDSVMTPTRAFR
jgi:hypothetical protein